MEKELSLEDLQRIAGDIMGRLSETDIAARQEIVRMARYLGQERIERFIMDALETEERGGLTTTTGQRRTLGGTFFFIAKKGTTGKERQQIWGPVWNAKRINTAQQTPPREIAPFVWAERLQALGAEGAAKVKVTLIGRPGKVIPKEGFIMTTMAATEPPSVPKGLPVPPAVTTPYLVFISAKQWKKAAVVVDDPEDALIIEGFGQYDSGIKGVAVWATSCTTKKIQRQQKAAQVEAPKP